MEEEIWLPIDGYENIYEVSNLGEIRSKDRFIYKNESKSLIKGKLLIGGFRAGYRIISLSKNNISKTKSIHRLIAEAFIPNTENKPYIDHINGIRTDNRVCNLKWATPMENVHNENTYQNYVIGNKNKKRREDSKDVYKIDIKTNKVIEIYKGYAEAARSVNASAQSIINWCKNSISIKSGYYWTTNNKYIINLEFNNKIDLFLNIDIVSIKENSKISNNTKKVYCINNNKIYNSCAEAEIDLKLVFNSVSRAARGERKHSNNYEFKYV